MHVASRSKACRKQVESQLQTCLKPSDDRTLRLMQQVRDQVFDKKSRKHVESKSKACRKPARTCRKPGCKPGQKPGLQPGLQLARIMECGFIWPAPSRAVSAASAIHSAATNHGELITLVAGKWRSLLMARGDDELYDNKSQRYAEDNRTAFNCT